MWSHEPVRRTADGPVNNIVRIVTVTCVFVYPTLLTNTSQSSTAAGNLTFVRRHPSFVRRYFAVLLNVTMGGYRTGDPVCNLLRPALAGHWVFLGC
ncbi:hypothetical protein M0657_005065 [Pyricularia oryzae]|nr:hypothetical protein M9X92_011011 [Pyricularia oryzae]KAI7923600.1 hypothetical protein M0657_005065 [Pyricularia oryzae]